MLTHDGDPPGNRQLGTGCGDVNAQDRQRNRGIICRRKRGRGNLPDFPPIGNHGRPDIWRWTSIQNELSQGSIDMTAMQNPDDRFLTEIAPLGSRYRGIQTSFERKAIGCRLHIVPWDTIFNSCGIEHVRMDLLQTDSDQL
jgi:hypothetical protein